MKTLFFSLLFLMSLQLFAFTASDLDATVFDQARDPQRCPGLVITPDQHHQIQALMTANGEQMRQLQQDAQNAMRGHLRVMINPSSTKDQAQASGQVVKEKMTLAMTLKEGLMMKVLFDILQGQQRSQLVRCKINEQQRRGDHDRRPPHPPRPNPNPRPQPPHPQPGDYPVPL